MKSDEADIVTRLRQTRADMIGTDDEQHYWDCHDAAAEIARLQAEIERLRLTDAEREAVRFCALVLDIKDRKGGDTLRGLLERTK